MLRRLARERRDYIYRKSLEAEEKKRYEKKRKIAEYLKEGKPIPTELREDEAELRKELEMEGIPVEPRNHFDDEYARAGITDPKIFLTTSRDPSSRLIQFVKATVRLMASQELKLIFPNSQRMNRGNHVIKELVDACRANDCTDIVIVHEHRGDPDGLIVSHLPYGPTAYFGLSNVVTRHDIHMEEKASEAYPHLLFHNFTSPLGERVRNILRYLFPVPKADSKRVITFANQNDYISFRDDTSRVVIFMSRHVIESRHHVYKKDGKDIILKEIGPRFEMRLYQIKLGTVDISEAENEWVLRPYMNTAKKRNHL